MKYILKKKKGFTLIEVIVGVALFAIVSMVLVSVMTFSLKMNYINKDSYDADSYSKAFYEALKNENCKPEKPTLFAEKNFYKLFDNLDEVTVYVRDKFSNIKNYNPSDTGMPQLPAGIDPSSGEVGFSDAKNHIESINSSGAKIAFIVQVSWDATNNVYQIETWTWNTDKGESTLINRKTLVAPRL